jgi:hypothetical protein
LQPLISLLLFGHWSHIQGLHLRHNIFFVIEGEGFLRFREGGSLNTMTEGLMVVFKTDGFLVVILRGAIDNKLIMLH